MGLSVTAMAQVNLPDLGQPEGELLSVSAEREVGEEIFQEIQSGRFGMPLNEDPEVNDYIQTLGNRLVRFSDVPGYPIEFFVVENPTINAMAFPGGFIGVHTGLITATQTESELASVMAHEIAHVSQRHIARSYMRQKQAQPLQMLALLFAVAVAGASPDAGMAAIGATMASGAQMFLNYSRDFEREADRIGFRTIERAGFNAGDYIGMFDKMYRNARLYDTGLYPAYMRTHPMTWERMADIDNLLKDRKGVLVKEDIGFYLVRTKLSVMRAQPKDALSEYTKQIAEKRYLKEYAGRYGLALAYLLNKQYDNAQQEIQVLEKQNMAHPMILALKARILLEQGKVDESVRLYQQGIKQYPDSFAILHDGAQTLLRANRAKEVIGLLTPKLVMDKSDSRLYAILAQAHQRLGNQALYHASLSEFYARKGNYHDAILQMEMAQNNKGASFYEQSMQDARLREFKRRFVDKNQLK